MLLYTKKAAPKAPKRRSRAGCIHCKEKVLTSHPVHPLPRKVPPSSNSKRAQKKKCNENRPQCDRCQERGLNCEYEAVKPRKKRRTSSAGSALSLRSEDSDRWPGRFGNGRIFYDQTSEFGVSKWEIDSVYQYPGSDESGEWETPYGIDVEEIIRTDLVPTAPAVSMTVAGSRSQYPDLAMIAPSPVASPLLEFCAPVFEEFTDRTNRRALVDHFCNVLSHLIVFKEDNGNPFRQLVLPLSHASSPIMNAIFALSSAHLEYRGVVNQEKSLDFHNKALQGLANLIEQNDQSNREEVLGAIMLLVYYEVLVQRGDSNIVNGHLKGAMTIMKSGPQLNTPTSQFLEHAFRFYDVIAALSLGTAPNSSTQPAVPSPFPTPPSPSGSIPPSPLSAVDTLLGLSTDLWPIIHRLSHLLPNKHSLEAAIAAGETSKATVLRTELESTSQAIENALTSWRPTFFTTTTTSSSCSSSPPTASPDSSTLPLLLQTQTPRIQSIYHNASAYRHSSLIYLHRTIRGLPRSHPAVQKHTHLALRACASVVSLAAQCLDGPMSALLWPLFVAACEATSAPDREMALAAFCGIERRQGMTNISRAWEVVREVWRRVDDEAEGGGEGLGHVSWRAICEERGFIIVFG
ncbi:uncharacterized protein L3040_004043 [Drepanopeziza brunnea f. sp. 'multigermtubi']|uniref:uncharacterized protein n=1 Tax=Drepanopeziza brunnea f. sp. 'multigermtubi' TaxID=698441 RepID=UPI00239350BC|nr:hypothetical protein L3040_004043 [Drepanopeziza brunnea f. sp. 'multigermtubi']